MRGLCKQLCDGLPQGISKYLFEISGKAAHSGLCYEGVSAIAEAAQKIIELEKFKDRDGLTFNCGTISGGTVPNTVPEQCTFTLDVRFSTNEEMKEADRIVEEISKKSFVAGATCRTTLLSRRVPMELRKENLELLDKINEVFSKKTVFLLFNKIRATAALTLRIFQPAVSLVLIQWEQRVATLTA